jgi:uncharacterized protein involved in exopolysaccharide biosynthesis
VADALSDAAPSDGLTFASWLARVVDAWRLVALVTGGVVALSILAMFVLAPTYRSHASFLAVASATSRAGVPAQYAGLAAQFGLGQNADPGTTPPFYAELLVSQGFLTDLALSKFADPRQRDTTSAAVGDSANLVQILTPRVHEPRRALDATLRKLVGIVRATPDARTNLVAITVDTRWPELSRDIANRSVSLVNAFNVDKRQSRARTEREFVATRLKEAEAELHEAEDTLRTYYERNRMWQQSPSGMLEEGRRRRRVTVANEVYVTLRREFETARIEEVNDQPVITVVDVAVTPVRRIWPRPIPVLAAAIVVGLLLGVGAAGTRVLFRDWAARNPTAAVELSSAIARLRRAALRGGRRPRGARASTEDGGVAARLPDPGS